MDVLPAGPDAAGRLVGAHSSAPRRRGAATRRHGFRAAANARLYCMHASGALPRDRAHAALPRRLRCRASRLRGGPGPGLVPASRDVSRANEPGLWAGPVGGASEPGL